ncbi:MAG TPA: PEP/pyruvate-binding domain-containing protein [Roseiflexaceae bacterium]|nr:PEP/pyruvate-binding domain-containing protein [Roseiflexaceae bacterium]
MIATQDLVDLREVGRGELALVGGKGANLGALLGAGFDVPPGFCLTTAAYGRFTAPAAAWIVERLAGLDIDDTRALDTASAEIRAHLEALPVPEDLAEAAAHAYHDLAERCRALGLLPPGRDELAVAVRSSATAEDLPDASFAGQQDTLLNIAGTDALLAAIKRCWSSLWTPRAIAYRARNGFRHEQVALSVIVQVMVDAEVAGVLFTADPLNGTRTHLAVNAAWGLGEAIVSGLVTPDTWTLDRSGQVLSSEPGEKAVMVAYAPGGGTVERAVPTAERARPSLNAGQLHDLAALGVRAEQFFGAPQDIEWAVAGGRLWLLQSRPITTLFPLPEPRPADGELHVYVSFHHLQGMLEPFTPMGLALFREIARTVQAFLGLPLMPPGRPGAFTAAGGRLFIDVSTPLRSPRARRVLLGAFGQIDPQSRRAVAAVLDDPRLTPKPALQRGELASILRPRLRRLARVPLLLLRTLRDPDRAVWRVEHEFQPRLLAILARAEGARTLAERAQMVRILFRGALPLMFSYVPPAFVPGMLSGVLVERLARRWGLPIERLTALRQGLPHNPTTTMDLALWGLSRTIDADPTARALFQQHTPEELARLFGAGQLPLSAQQGLRGFLERYGHRGVREIDIGIARWSEDPSYVLGILKTYVQIDDPDHAPDRHFAALQRGAADAARQLLSSARTQRLGRFKAGLLGFLIRRQRTLSGLREGPKFWVIRVFASIRRLLRGCGDILAARGLLEQADDVFFLTLDELDGAEGRSATQLRQLVAERRREYAQELRRQQSPRILTSEGLAVYGRAQTLGAGALAGVGVSPGVAQGRARIIRDPHGAQLSPGDILVAPSTDPAWTPLFLAAGGLVMEAGGMLSHGSVVAREYGIPAVVGVGQATTTLRDGQLIRVDGNSGVVEPVPEA